MSLPAAKPGFPTRDKPARLMLVRASLVLALIAAPAPFLASPAPAEYVPYTPTPQAMVDRMLELADVEKGDFLIDLGCGDGRILVRAAERFGARGLGVDIDEQRLVEANALARKAGVVDKVTFRNENLFDADISKATVLFLYLSLAIDIELRPRILKTMRPGARVLSHHFNMGDWLPDKWEMVEGRMLYYWLVPAQVGGSWQVTRDGTDGKGRFALDLDQHFQFLKGNAQIGGKAVPVQDGRVTGERIRFVIDKGDGDRAAYEGQLVDGRLEGDGWTAMRR